MLSRPAAPESSPASLLDSSLSAPVSAYSLGLLVSPDYLIAPFLVVGAADFACCFDGGDSRIEDCSGLFVVG